MDVSVDVTAATASWSSSSSDSGCCNPNVDRRTRIERKRDAIRASKTSRDANALPGIVNDVINDTQTAIRHDYERDQLLIARWSIDTLLALPLEVVCTTSSVARLKDVRNRLQTKTG
jgi:hypothetical protein